MIVDKIANSIDSRSPQLLFSFRSPALLAKSNVVIDWYFMLVTLWHVRFPWSMSQTKSLFDPDVDKWNPLPYRSIVCHCLYNCNHNPILFGNPLELKHRCGKHTICWTKIRTGKSMGFATNLFEFTRRQIPENPVKSPLSPLQSH